MAVSPMRRARETLPPQPSANTSGLGARTSSDAGNETSFLLRVRPACKILLSSGAPVPLRLNVGCGDAGIDQSVSNGFDEPIGAAYINMARRVDPAGKDVCDGCSIKPPPQVGRPRWWLARGHRYEGEVGPCCLGSFAGEGEILR